MQVKCYSCAADCLRDLGVVGEKGHFCVVCGLHEIGMPGLEFQNELGRCPHATSIVFHARHAEVWEIVDAMRRGAVAVVEQDDDMTFQSLYQFVDEGIDRSAVEFQHARRCRRTLEQLGSLNAGEHQVLQGIVAGKLNKEMAYVLKLSIRTIEQRRREVFRKMDVDHPASLTRKVLQAAHAPRRRTTGDDQAEWLDGIRHDMAHSPLVRSVACGSSEDHGTAVASHSHVATRIPPVDSA